MFTRMTWLEDVHGSMDDAVAAYEQDVVPVLRGCRGYVASVVGLEQDEERALVITFFEDAAAIEASRPGSARLRIAISTRFGYPVSDVGEYEMALRETAALVEPGNYARFLQMHMPPEELDGALERFRRKVVPKWRELAGFRNGFGFVDRQTGDLVGGSTWASLEDLEASEVSVAALRADTPPAAGRREVYELLAVDGRVPAHS